ncbi:hypothetical protein LUX01_02930 [Streptomyces sudanensis]|uniref:hypothetical protein n=1 Tax=Streptomyces sudanensis TaxID=436397 RepID=UPI0020CDE7BB|nr:hypothetical protein [Streptomyces sudanensis]MCP9985811.1 hypothetical protein [Streptomyces sudanensis]
MPEAFTDGEEDGEVLMRAGAVLVRVQGDGVTDEKVLGQFARLRIERVREAATGQDPDA